MHGRLRGMRKDDIIEEIELLSSYLVMDRDLDKRVSSLWLALVYCRL